MPTSAVARHFSKMARTPNLLISLSFLVFVSSKLFFFLSKDENCLTHYQTPSKPLFSLVSHKLHLPLL